MIEILIKAEKKRGGGCRRLNFRGKEHQNDGRADQIYIAMLAFCMVTFTLLNFSCT